MNYIRKNNGKLEKQNRCKTLKQQKRQIFFYLKWASKSSYMTHKKFDNDLVAISKSKVALTFNKPAYIETFILELSKVSMYEFQFKTIIQRH